MKNQDIQAFRTLVNDDDGLRAKFIGAYQHGPGAVAAMAKQHGFEVSEEEVVAALESVEADGELTDVELELVSGGGKNSQDVSPQHYSRPESE